MIDRLILELNVAAGRKWRSAGQGFFPFGSILVKFAQHAIAKKKKPTSRAARSQSHRVAFAASARWVSENNTALSKANPCLRYAVCRPRTSAQHMVRE